MRIVEITREPVELYKILKFEGLITTGGEAKLLIGDGQVTVNGEIETRRRRKMANGDVIEFRGDRLQLRLVRFRASDDDTSLSHQVFNIEKADFESIVEPVRRKTASAKGSTVR
jgi:ribosome-associated protein